MVLSSLNFHHEIAFIGVQVLNASGSVDVELVAQSELSEIVKTPCEHLVFVIQVETVHLPAKNVNC